MVTVKVRSIAFIRELLGTEQLELSFPSGATVADVLARLAEVGGSRIIAYLVEPEEKSAYAPLRIMVNGRDISVLQGRATPVADDDDILVFAPIAGG